MENPYQSSTVNPTLQQPAYKPQNLVATQTAISHLASSKGWLRFISVLLYILFAITLLSLFFILALASSASLGGVELILIPIMIAYATTIFFFAFRLGGYASAISRLTINRSPLDLETAMIQQMKFWRTSGIIMIIGIIFFIISTL